MPSDTPSDTPSETASDDTETDYMNPVGVLPIVKEGQDITIKVFLRTTEMVTDLYTNDYTLYLTEKTGIKFEWEQPLEADAQDRLNLLINTDEYPDVIMSNFNRDSMNAWAIQGIIIPLDDLIEKYAPNTMKFLEEDPLRRVNLLAGDPPQIYAMPSCNECLHCYVDSGIMYYYYPFQKTLGLSEPKTIDEFTDNLRAIRDGDPNGNGKNDEIPMLVRKGQENNLFNIIANCYFPMGTTHPYGMTIIDDEPVFQWMNPKAKEVFKYIKMLYDEGLINKDFISLEDTDPIADGDIDIVGWQLGGHNDEIWKKYSGTGRWPMAVAIPAFKGPEGIGYSPYKGTYERSSPAVLITDKCKYPEVVVRLVDWMYELEPTLNGYIGPQGECWDWPDEGAVGLNGEPALYKILVNYGTQRVNSGWDQANPSLRTAAFRLGEQATDMDIIQDFYSNRTIEKAKEVAQLGSFNEINNYECAKVRLTTRLPDEYNVPPVIYTMEESQRIAEIRAVVDPFISQARVEFITGERDIEADWDDYIRELERMGLPEYLEIQKAALARMYPDRFKN